MTIQKKKEQALWILIPELSGSFFHTIIASAWRFSLKIEKTKKIEIYDGWILEGAVRRIFPCVTYEIKSVSFHLLAKNPTRIWPDLLSLSRKYKHYSCYICVSLHHFFQTKPSESAGRACLLKLIADYICILKYWVGIIEDFVNKKKQLAHQN